MQYQYDSATALHTLIINSDTLLSFSKPDPSAPAQILDEEAVETRMSIGDTDGVSPPWFVAADAALLFHFLHRERMILPIKLVHRRNSEILDLVVTNNNDPSAPAPSSLPVLVSISLPAHGPVRFTFPRASSAPSGAYLIRRTLLAVLAPTALLFMVIAGAAIYVFKFIALGVALWGLWFLWDKQRQSAFNNAESVGERGTQKHESVGIPLAEKTGQSSTSAAPVDVPDSRDADVQNMV